MLKEGFAVYFADIGMDKVYPEWNIVIGFLLLYILFLRRVMIWFGTPSS